MRPWGRGGVRIGVHHGPRTRPIGEFIINLPRPRDVAEIRLTPEYLELHERIWHAMREEVLKGYAQTNA